jgi:hypothetical protein
MAGGRWEFGTGQLANFAASVMSQDHTAVNPFKPATVAAKPEAAREAESKAGWAALREFMKGRAADYRRKHGHKTTDGKTEVRNGRAGG